MNWTCLAILTVVSLIGCAVGFKRFIWFLTIGYGFAVEFIAVVCALYAIFTSRATAGIIAACVVCALYGLRLGVFLLKRELGNQNYKKILDAKVGKEPPVFVKAIVWLLVGVLYVCQTAGLHFRMTNGTPDDWTLYLGILVMACGAVIEALADKQKSEQKNKNPGMPAMEGLFTIVRCPNYLGEMIFWTGVFLCGVTSYRGALQWVAALLGYVCILYIMIDGAIRMEKGHDKRYGDKVEYLAYARKTPLVIPFVGKHK